MAYYRVYFLDSSSRIERFHELHCTNDSEACERASVVGADKTWELWRGSERISCPPAADRRA